MPLDPKHVEAVFLAATEASDPAARAAILERECGDDTELRQRVEALLRADTSRDSVLDAMPQFEEAASDSEQTQALDSSASPPTIAPATETSGPGSASSGDHSYLKPSTKPGSIGRLDHYEILEVIGAGGFGTVYKAFDEKLHRIVAIKVLSPAFAANGAARARFIREARTAAAIKNEHVVGIYDVNKDAEPPYLAMEMIDGCSLQDKLDKHGPLGLKEILRIGSQMAEGLSAAHKQGLVHRDIKPANILLENGVERVKITDFGLARSVDDASVTQSGVVAGTPMYMSPEQAEGVAIDHRSDLFSLGTVLYAMCTGHPPFRASGTHAVLKRVIDASPRPIREINNEIPDWLCDVIGKLHAKKPEDRFQSAREVAELLGGRLADLQAGRDVQAEPRQVRGRVKSPVGRWRRVAGMLPIVLIGVLFIFAAVHLATKNPYAMQSLTLAIGVTLLVLIDRLVLRSLGWRGRLTALLVIAGIGFTGTELFGLSRFFYAPSYPVGVTADDPDTRMRLWKWADDKPPTGLEGDVKILGEPAYTLENLSTAELDLPAGNYLLVADLNGQEADRQFIKLGHNRFETTRHLPGASWGGGANIGVRFGGLGDRINGQPHRSVIIKASANLARLKGYKKEPGWVQLFNGDDLRGWREFGDNRVKDGDITLFPGSAIDTLERMPRNFHLRMRVKLLAGDAVIRFRAEPREAQPNPPPPKDGWYLRLYQGGPKVSFQFSPRNPSGGDGDGGTTYLVGGANIDKWINLEIIAKEDNAVVLIDGKPELSRDGKSMAGVISLWNTGRRDARIAFRNIEIKDLTPASEPVRATPGWAEKCGSGDPSKPAVWPNAIAPNGKMIFLGGVWDVQLLDFATGKKLRSLQQPETPGASGWTRPCFSPDSKYVAAINWNQVHVWLWDTATGQRVADLRGHTGGVADVSFLAGGKYVLTAGVDKTLRVWDARTGKELPLQGAKQPGLSWRSVTVVPGTDQVILGSDRRLSLFKIILADAPAEEVGPHWSFHIEREFPAPVSEQWREWYTDLSVSADGQRLLASPGESRLGLYDVITGKLIRQLDIPVPAKTRWHLAMLLPDGKRCVLAIHSDPAFKDTPVVALCDTETGQVLQTFNGFTGTIDGLAVSSDGKYALGSDSDRMVRLWKLPGPPAPGWVQLFNGKDTRGWIVPAPGTGEGDWHVDKQFGQLVGRGPTLSYVFTERDDFADFHLKTEVSCTGGTDSGIFFRCGKDLLHGKFPAGYEANTGFELPFRTGALLLTTPDSQKAQALFNPQFGATMAEFHLVEIIARGKRIIVKIDGKIVTDFTDDKATYTKGRIALQVASSQGRGAVVFKTIEIKELPHASRLIAGWGEVIDPDGDCTIDQAKGRVRIAIPGKYHDVSALYKKFNAPRVLSEVKGDFRARVKVLPFRNVGARLKDDPKGDPFAAAGLLVWCDQGQFVRLTRAAYSGATPNTDPEHNLEIFGPPRDAKPLPKGFVQADREKPSYLKLERRGNIVSMWTSLDGIAWHGPHSTALVNPPLSVKVGVVALCSFTRGEFVVEFEDFQVEELPPPEPGWVQLFNGKDLTGWDAEKGLEHWKVVDNVLAGTAPSGLILLPTVRKDYGNFHLRAQARIKGPGNSGILFRGQYQAEIEATQYTGGIALNQPFKWLGEKTHSLVKANEWFTLEIVATGARLRTTVNGIPVADVTDATAASGGFALELNAQKGPVAVDFKKIEIKELPPPEPGWVQLFNGKDLEAWQPSDKWQVKNGILVATGPAFLRSKHSYRDFQCRLTARYNKEAVASISFRGRPFETHGEVAINKHAMGMKTGSVHFFSKAKSEWVTKWNQELVSAGDWFDLELVVRGKHVIAKVNGTTTANVPYDGLLDEGFINLNAYEPGTMLEFKKIEIKELPPPEPGWVQLFNGKDLDGWVMLKDKKSVLPERAWEIIDGVLIARGSPNGYLHTEKTYGDFILEFQCQPSQPFVPGKRHWAGDLMFQATVPDPERADMSGMRLQIEPGKKSTFAMIGTKSGKVDVADWSDFKPGWNDVRIESSGGKFIMSLNGKTNLTAADYPTKRGSIAIMSVATGMRYRNLRIKELPPEEPAWARFMSGNAEFINPGGDCKVSADGARLRLTVPGKARLLEPKMDMSAPRILQEVEGDFLAQVHVHPFPMPDKGSARNKELDSLAAAGLLVWQDADNFVSLYRETNERAAIPYESGPYLMHRVQLGGKKLDSVGFPLAWDSGYVQIERKGSELIFRVGSDGKKWRLVRTIPDVKLPTKLKVGLVAVNNASTDVDFKFEDFKVTRVPPSQSSP